MYMTYRFDSRTTPAFVDHERMRVKEAYLNVIPRDARGG